MFPHLLPLHPRSSISHLPPPQRWVTLCESRRMKTPLLGYVYEQRLKPSPPPQQRPYALPPLALPLLRRVVHEVTRNCSAHLRGSLR